MVDEVVVELMLSDELLFDNALDSVPVNSSASSAERGRCPIMLSVSIAVAVLPPPASVTTADVASR
jgi:hypothetical protein